MIQSPHPLADVGERRTNVVLRALIDEMLDLVRELHRHGPALQPAERQHAEATLAAIMARVKLEATTAENAKPFAD